MIEHFLFEGVLSEDETDRPTLRVSDEDAARAIFKRIMLSASVRRAPRRRSRTAAPHAARRKARRSGCTALTRIYSQPCAIGASETAAAASIAPYVVFHDSTWPRSSRPNRNRSRHYPAFPASVKQNSRGMVKRCLRLCSAAPLSFGCVPDRNFIGLRRPRHFHAPPLTPILASQKRESVKAQRSHEQDYYASRVRGNRAGARRRGESLRGSNKNCRHRAARRHAGKSAHSETGCTQNELMQVCDRRPASGAGAFRAPGWRPAQPISLADASTLTQILIDPCDIGRRPRGDLIE